MAKWTRSPFMPNSYYRRCKILWLHAVKPYGCKFWRIIVKIPGAVTVVDIEEAYSSADKAKSACTRYAKEYLKDVLKQL